MKTKASSNSVIQFTPKQLLLRTGLAINATFSVLCAVGMLVYGQQLAALMGRINPLLLQMIGLSLLFFASELVLQISKRRLSTLRALFVSIMDVGWVLASLVLLVFFPDLLSGSGAVIVSLVAAVVLLCSLLQLFGIHRIHAVPGRKTYRHCVPMAVEASAESLWYIIGNLDSIAQYAPHIASSRLVNSESSGEGSVRICQDISGKQWSEQCTVYDPKKQLDLKFLTEEPNFPLPVKEMEGGWQLKKLDEGRCEVRVWWELEPKIRAFALILMPIFSHLMDRDFKQVMNKMAEEGNSAKVKNKKLARLIPMPC